MLLEPAQPKQVHFGLLRCQLYRLEERAEPVPSDAVLIGVVQSYIPYSDTAIREQTGRVGPVFTDNSGLTRVLPITLVEENVAHAVALNPALKLTAGQATA